MYVSSCGKSTSRRRKRTGSQRALQWRRTCCGWRRSQTLDVICFGQRDGPEVFSRQTDFIVYIIRIEIEYADACYPPNDPRLIAYIWERRRAAERLGVAPEYIRSWLSLAWLMAMIDDFWGG